MRFFWKLSNRKYINVNWGPEIKIQNEGKKNDMVKIKQRPNATLKKRNMNITFATGMTLSWRIRQEVSV